MKPPANPLAGTIGRLVGGKATEPRERRGFYFPSWRRRVRRPGDRIRPATDPLDDKVRVLGVKVNGYAERQGELGGYLGRAGRSDGR